MAARSAAAGSVAASQASWACASPALPYEPVTRNAFSSRPSCSHSSTVDVARASFHSIAGRTGSPSASTSQQPSPCPVTASRSTRPSAGATSATTCSTAAHTSAMSCSAQPGRGRVTAVAVLAWACASRSSPNRTALTIDVPASTPIATMPTS